MNQQETRKINLPDMTEMSDSSDQSHQADDPDPMDTILSSPRPSAWDVR